jgi:hypothetical protein
VLPPTARSSGADFGGSERSQDGVAVETALKPVRASVFRRLGSSNEPNGRRRWSPFDY